MVLYCQKSPPSKSECGVERIKRAASVVVDCPGEAAQGERSEGGLGKTWVEVLTWVVGIPAWRNDVDGVGIDEVFITMALSITLKMMPTRVSSVLPTK